MRRAGLFVAASLAFAFGPLVEGGTALANESAIGFGAGASGGCAEPRCVCHVRSPTQEALAECLAVPGPGKIVFDKNAPIHIDSPSGGRRASLKIPSNKTISGPVTLISNGTTLEIDGQSNIVIRDVSFRSDLSDHPSCRGIRIPRDASRCGIPINVIGASRKIWIDHDDFAECGEKCIEVWAEPNPGQGGGPVPSPDLVTISNSRFANSFFGIAIGVNARTAAADLPEHERVTLYGNLFDHVFRRTPRVASGAWAHVFNNVFRNWGGAGSCVGATKGFGPSATGGGQLLLENNVFEAWSGGRSCKLATDISEYEPAAGESRGPGNVRSTGNLGVNGAEVDSNLGRVFEASSLYSYTLLPPESVLSEVMANAGARGAAR